jgi:hypothetical protein
MKSTQRGKILAYCAEHGSITIREAFEELDINSPSKRISEMRRCGYDVQTIEETKRKENGEVSRYKRYFIKEVADG